MSIFDFERKSGATSLLYAGQVDGEAAWKTARALADSTAGEVGESRIAIVDRTPVGQLLFSSEFNTKLKALVTEDLQSRIPGFDSLSPSEKVKLVTERTLLLFNGSDATGKRIGLNPAFPSAWDIASANLVRDAPGDFRILGGDPLPESIMSSTELPALYDKGAHGADFKVGTMFRWAATTTTL